MDYSGFSRLVLWCFSLVVRVLLSMNRFCLVSVVCRGDVGFGVGIMMLEKG